MIRMAEHRNLPSLSYPENKQSKSKKYEHLPSLIVGYFKKNNVKRSKTSQTTVNSLLYRLLSV